MTTTSYVVVIRDAITGQQVGSLAKYGGTIREAVTGFGVGTASPLVTISHIRDAVTGQSVGSHMSTLNISREVATGSRVGLALFPEMMTSVREVLGRDTSYKFQANMREVLISSTNEWVTIAWEARSTKEIVNQRRATMRTPPNVWSFTPVPSYVQVVPQRRVRVKPISMHQLYAATSLALQERGALAPPGVLSMTRLGAYKQVVLQSRSIPYTPASGNFVPALKQVALQHRVVPAQTRSSISAKTEQQIVALSRRDNSRYAKTLVEIVLLEKAVIFSAPTPYAGLFELLAQRRVNPTWHSVSTVSTVGQVALQERAAEIPLSVTAVPSYNQVLAQHRDLPWWHSTTELAGQQQIALQRHDVVRYYSDMFVSALRQVVLSHFVPGPQPPTAMYVQPYRMLVAQDRGFVEPPSRVSWWYTPAVVQVAAQSNAQPAPISAMDVGSLRVQYILAAKYPPPDEVMGPENGAIIPVLYEVAVQHRVVEAPHAVNASRFVLNLGEQVLLGDEFPDPDLPASSATVGQVIEQGVLGAAYADPALPQSDVTALSVATVGVLGDVYPDPRLAQSTVAVSALSELAVLGAAYPDPLLPSSDLTATSVAGVAVLGDASFPDPTLPQSEVQTTSVASSVALGDTSYPPPSDAMSTLDALSIGELVVIVDRSLYGIPKRTDRRRPIVSVSIT